MCLQVYYQLAESMKQSARTISSPFRSAPKLSKIESPYPSCPLPPSNPITEQIEAREKKRQQKALRIILLNHLKTLATSGLTGIVSLVVLAAMGLRIVAGATGVCIRHLFGKAVRSMTLADKK